MIIVCGGNQIKHGNWHRASHEMLVKGKGKVVLVLVLAEHHAMKAYWGVEV
jgi:hypothetical protein